MSLLSGWAWGSSISSYATDAAPGKHHVWQNDLGPNKLPYMPEAVLTSAEATKLMEVQPASRESLYSAILDTLIAHGLDTTVAALKREPNLGVALQDIVHHELCKPVIPLGMPDSVAYQYQDAQKLSGQQQKFVEECATEARKQRARLQQLRDNLHSLRLDAFSPMKEGAELLEQQRMRLVQLRISAAPRESQTIQLRQDIENRTEEVKQIFNFIEATDENHLKLKAHVLDTQERIAKMRTALDSSPASQAQRIRHVLLHWDDLQCAQGTAEQTFAHVDSDRDGRIEWANDEICRFVRLLFHYHYLELPQWSTSIWYALFSFSGFNHQYSVNVNEVMKFARCCFEAALRTLIS